MAKSCTALDRVRALKSAIMVELRAAKLEDKLNDDVSDLFNDITREMVRAQSKFRVRPGASLQTVPTRRGCMLSDHVWHPADDAAFTAFQWNGDLEAAGIALDMSMEGDGESDILAIEDWLGDEWRVRRGYWIIYDGNNYTVLSNRVFQSTFEPISS